MTVNHTRPPLTVTQATDLAGDLILSLAALAGDLEAVNAELRHWHDVLDTRDLARVCMAVVQMTFAECMAITPVEQLPPSQLVLVEPPTERKPA